MDESSMLRNNDIMLQPLHTPTRTSYAMKLNEYSCKSPSGSEWKKDMEKRVERMEKTLDRAANIMNAYFGESSHFSEKSPFKDRTNSMAKNVGNSTCKSLPSQSPSERVRKQYRSPLQSIAGPCHGSDPADGLCSPIVPSAPEEVTDNTVYYAPYVDRRRSRNFLEPAKYQAVERGSSPLSSNKENVACKKSPMVTTVTVTPNSRRIDIKINLSEKGVTSINFET